MLGRKFITMFALLGLLGTQVVLAGTWETNQRIGGFNSVHVYNPSVTSPHGGKGLLVALHGCAQTNTDMKGANLDKAADQWGMVVALPKVGKPAGIASCWEYWSDGVIHTRNTDDHKRILDMVSTLLANAKYQIDPNQVYITGLSSGAAFAHVMGCLAPDVFAGVSSFAGPSPGSTSGVAIGGFQTVDVAAECRRLAGSYAEAFNTQVAGLAQGEGTSPYLATDGTVHKDFLPQNAEGMARLYGASLTSNGAINFEGVTINQKLWSDGEYNRVSQVSVPSLGHAWPGGAGASGAYVDASTGFNYGRYVAKFFTENNMRVGSVVEPLGRFENLSVSGSGCNLTASGRFVVKEGAQLVSVTVSVQNEDVAAVLDANGNFSVSMTVGTNYEHSVVFNGKADDGEGIATITASKSITLGTPPVKPSYCQYIDPGSYQYLPDCQDKEPQQCGGGNTSRPSWCTDYLAQWVAACK